MCNYLNEALEWIRRWFLLIPFVSHESENGTKRRFCNFARLAGVDVAWGATRICLVIPGKFVVKFDYGQTGIFGGCDEEWNLFRIAERQNMEGLLAPITKYVYCGRVFFVMPFIGGINGEDWRDAYMIVSKEERRWLRAHGVCDLHSGNFGWLNGRPVLIDYACQRTPLSMS